MPSLACAVWRMAETRSALLTGLAVTAWQQKCRVRFATAAVLINELVVAKH
jgi:hypothetical protein